MNAKNTEFRIWIYNIWLDFLEERQANNEFSNISVQQYFQTYKYWLKREFQSQKKANSNRFIDVVLDDKLDSSDIRLLSDQNKYIRTLKDSNEK